MVKTELMKTSFETLCPIVMITGVLVSAQSSTTKSSIATRVSSESGSFALDCSAYGINSTNTTIQRMSWAARLRACFNDNPYDLTQPPLPSLNDPTASSSIYISYDYAVVYVISFDGNSISLMGQVSMQWTDKYRIWNSLQFPLIAIQIPLSEIWHPQILFQSATKKKSFKLVDADDTVLAFSDHMVLTLQNVVDGHCEINYSRFPFDIQVCSIDFILNKYFVEINDIILIRDTFTYQFQKFPNEEWEILSVKSLPTNITFEAYIVDPNGLATNTLNFTGENAQTGFTVNITLRRFPQFFIINLGVPVFVLTAVEQTSFAIPEHADSKIVVPLTVLLGFLFIQSIVAVSLPQSPITPSFNSYVIACVILSGATCIVCALLSWLTQCHCRVPRTVAKAIYWAQVVLFPSHWPVLIRKLRARKTERQSSANGSGIEAATTGAAFDSDGQENQNQQQVAANNSQVGSNGSKRQSIGSHAEGSNKQFLESQQWEPLADILNRLFAIAHLAAILALFFSLVLPLVINSSTTVSN